MANIKSAMKRTQITRVRTAKNAALKSQMRSVVRRFDESLASGDIEAAKKNLVKCMSVIDHVETKGVIHKNTASRKKARLSKALAKSC